MATRSLPPEKKDCKLLRYVSQLKSLEPALLDGITADVQSQAISWCEPYPEYASAGLKVATLFNSDGRGDNFDYHDCRKPVPTPLAASMPHLRGFVEELGFHLMGARLLLLEPGTFLHEHRDYVYLEDVPRFRLHVPLSTNAAAFITSPGINIHFKRGFIWKLDPKETVHSACNFGDTARIHLMMDCYGNDALFALIEKQWLDDALVHRLPGLTQEAAANLLVQAAQLMARGEQKAAEEVLLSAFCKYDMGNTTTYDLLFRLYAGESRFSQRLAFWRERLLEVYPERKQSSAPARKQYAARR